MNRVIALLAALGTATSATALTLDFPASAKLVAEEVTPLGSYQVPISGYEDGQIDTIWAEGEVRQQAWHVNSAGLTTLQLLAPLRDQLIVLGFESIFECTARDCGGFDFRYAMEVLPEPDMHVDLGDYRYLAMQRMGSERPEYVSLLISRSESRGFAQITRIGPDLPQTPLVITSTKTPETSATEFIQPDITQTKGELVRQLEEVGRAVLTDLSFETGSSRLAKGDFGSLSELSEYLTTHPERSIVLVGHTDAEGSLGGNIALSKKRASAVLKRLTGDLGVASKQVKAEGVGFLSPLTTNLTQEGRTLNRRVEVILSTTE